MYGQAPALSERTAAQKNGIEKITQNCWGKIHVNIGISDFVHIRLSYKENKKIATDSVLGRACSSRCLVYESLPSVIV